MRDSPSLPATLTDEALARGLRVLCKRNVDLARIFDDLGTPPMWARAPGFPTLVHIILEQQVSLASAQAAYDRLLAAASPLTPENFLALDKDELKRIGFSWQKTAYGYGLAQTIIDGQLDLAALETQDDETVRAELTKIKGIGRWSADVYLLMVLLRPDIWPVGDLALAAAAQSIKQLPSRPTQDELETIGADWKPWRAVAARMLWQFYLSRRRTTDR